MAYDLIPVDPKRGAVMAVRVPGVASGEIPLTSVLCIGRNYAEHAKERGAEAPTRPMVFLKYPGSLTPSGAPIVIPPVCDDPVTGGAMSASGQVDFEGELAVVIGEPARDVPVERAMDVVLGYCCANDVSARWWQKEGSGGQFTRGKSFDSFCPLGPTVTPAGEVLDPQALRLTTMVSGEVMQDGSTADMLFPVATLIAELSRGATLLPGTVILTGTPSGVGAGRNPPRFLRPGDEVRVSITGGSVDLGTLVNAVKSV
jgi:2-keto-4-pentenoate hydratase/2-oxohepta-3-ene-1,7-dioic acid hydratase in catechol pathway